MKDFWIIPIDPSHYYVGKILPMMLGGLTFRGEIIDSKLDERGRRMFRVSEAPTTLTTTQEI